MERYTSKGTLISEIEKNPELEKRLKDFLKRSKVVDELHDKLKEYCCLPEKGSSYSNGDIARGGFIKIHIEDGWSQLNVSITGWRKWSVDQEGNMIDLEQPIQWKAKGYIENKDCVIFKYEIKSLKAKGKTVDEFFISEDDNFEFLNGTFTHSENNTTIKGTVNLQKLDSATSELQFRQTLTL